MAHFDYFDDDLLIYSAV